MQITRRVSLSDKDDFYKFWYTQSKHNLLCFRQSLWQIFEVRMVLQDNKILNLHVASLKHESCVSLAQVWPGHRNWQTLSYKFSLLSSYNLSCNSCSRLTRTWQLRKLLHRLSLVNSHATLVHFWQRHESYKFLFVNSHQLSCNSC